MRQLILSLILLCAPFLILAEEGPLQMLMDGNDRYVRSATICRTDWDIKRARLAEKQTPFAVIVCCSDSRVPPEIIFDQTLGKLFVVRLAGNIVDDIALGSIEYALAALKVPFIIVLGHAGCGAVKAALAGAHYDNHIDGIIKALQPAVQSVKGVTDDQLEKAIKANVNHVVAQLKGSKQVIAPLVLDNKVKIVGGYYDLQSGKVEIILNAAVEDAKSTQSFEP